MSMNSGVRRRLCATHLQIRNVPNAIAGRLPHDVSTSRSTCESISRYIGSNRAFVPPKTTTRVAPQSLQSLSTIQQPLQGVLKGISIQELRNTSARWQGQSDERARFENKIWDRRKYPGIICGSRRHFSESVKRLNSHSNEEFKGADRVKDPGKASHSGSESSYPQVRKALQENVAGTEAASDAAQKHLRDRLPHIPQIHRPSKEELLAAATGFWSRLKVRFKWFSIRSARPFNADEIGAFFSWVLVGHVIWIVLGTTTFFSLAILAVNTVFAQGEFSSE